MSSLQGTRSSETDSDTINAALFPHYEISAPLQKHNYIMVDFRNKHQYTTGESVGNPGKKNDVYLKKGNFKKNTKTQILYYIPQKDIDDLKGLLPEEERKIAKCIVLTKLKEGKYKMANDDAYAPIYKIGVTAVAGAKQGNHTYVGSDKRPVGTGHFKVDLEANVVKDTGKYRLYYTDFLKSGTAIANAQDAVQNLKAKDFSSSTDPYVDIGIGLEHAVPDPIILNIKGDDAEDIELKKYWAEPTDAGTKADVNAANIILGEDHVVVFNTTDTQKKSIKDNKPKPKTGHLLIGKEVGGKWVREDKDDDFGNLYYSLFTTEWHTRLNDGVFLWGKKYMEKELFKMYNDLKDDFSISENTHKFFYVPYQHTGEKIDGSDEKIVDMTGDNIYGSVPLTLINAKQEKLNLEAAFQAGFKFGDTVLYRTHDPRTGEKIILNVDLKWTPASIDAVNADGTYNLRYVPTPQIYLGILFDSYYTQERLPHRHPDEVINAAASDTVVNPDGVDSFTLKSGILKAEIKKPSDISNWQQFCNNPGGIQLSVVNANVKLPDYKTKAMQDLWDEMSSAEVQDYEIVRENLINELKKNEAFEEDDKSKLTVTIAYADLVTIVEKLGVVVAKSESDSRISRSVKSSIDEKLDALIYIQSELISLLKEKLL
jgi:hypothetical protein